jgi:hypothetical protein
MVELVQNVDETTSERVPCRVVGKVGFFAIRSMHVSETVARQLSKGVRQDLQIKVSAHH